MVENSEEKKRRNQEKAKFSCSELFRMIDGKSGRGISLGGHSL